ncbi:MULTISPECIES: alpha,alpha-trehalose-phosphate synthase (UDP-forming) [Sphingomonadales]|nr:MULTISPECIES: trehalose-6-phosphate synthase [Sphingomonas]AGH49006.1 alpha,alpha-trehalose-phosphate synthase [Sphingomonas sp. MM-1]MDX3885327.1 trehalose-6-phosphate synthase [Sphingomonas sp.]OHT21425.1 Alpha,alpha-trehalose-phosphate synthase UDP-forming [Sphingomonas haloaromaticamans]
MSRLIVISNRVQPAADGAGNQGGLAVALSAALRESNGIWFGWSGGETDHFTGHINFQRHDGVATATVDLEPQDVEEYYNGFANRTLWPLFHYRIDVAEFERGFAEGYERVNARFAETVQPLIEPDDILWVHDYHLIPLGAELRARGVTNRIGFFLHIPWPPMQLLLALPNHRELVEAMFAYDVIGFHTRDWLDSFLDYVSAELPGAVIGADDIITLNGRSIRAVACPIGIDTQAFRDSANQPNALNAFQRMRISANGREMIIGVDRLDYSKGLQERFLGYERFLASHPEALGRVFLLQIAPPSREDVQSYREIRAALDGLSGRINGEYADVEWVPIRYVNKGYPRDELAGIYRAARIGLVTPLRDGMNLVAKEYVAAQDPEDPGVLILSRFAGAAEQMGEALLVNPHSAEDVADAIARALAMPRAERIRRWRALMDGVEQEDVLWWQRRFTALLAAPDPEAPADRAAA